MQPNASLQVLVEELNTAVAPTVLTEPKVAIVLEKVAKVNLIIHFYSGAENLESSKTKIEGLYASPKLLDYVLVLAEISYSLKDGDSLSYTEAIERLRTGWPTDSLLNSVWCNLVDLKPKPPTVNDSSPER
jgi:hypothetical protein